MEAIRKAIARLSNQYNIPEDFLWEEISMYDWYTAEMFEEYAEDIISSLEETCEYIQSHS